MIAAAALPELLLRDASWMLGNLGLAWIGVLFAVRAQAAAPRMPVAALLLVAGAVLFAPNAPYVLTDGMHYVRDLRRVELDFADGAILAIVYGWFLTLGVAAWIVLLDLARCALPRRAHVPALAVASLLAALAIYVGRIERIHSWHVVTRPRATFDAFTTVVIHAGPATFVAAWTIVVAAVGVIGLASRALLRCRHPDAGRVRLVAGWAWFVAGALLSGLPLVGLLDPSFGVATPRADRADGALAVFVGISLAAYGLRLLHVLRMGRVAQIVYAAIPVVLVGWVLVAGSMLGWWAQYQALCTYGPGTFVPHASCR